MKKQSVICLMMAVCFLLPCFEVLATEEIVVGGFRLTLPAGFFYQGIENGYETYACYDNKQKQTGALLLTTVNAGEIMETASKNGYTDAEYLQLLAAEIEKDLGITAAKQDGEYPGTQCGPGYICRYEEYTREICMGLAADKENKTCLCAFLILRGSMTDKTGYRSDFVSMVSETEKASGREQKGNTSWTGVTPSFKKTMDSYEKFFDDYIAFMKNFDFDSSDFGTLSKYAVMIGDYTKMEKELEKLDESNMSDADYAYYLEVSARIMRKLEDIQ